MVSNLSDRYEYDHKRYIEQREARLEAAKIYYQEYQKKGLRKPRRSPTPEERKERRRQKQHERYMMKHDEICAQQKAFREANKEIFKEKRRRRNFEMVYGRPYI